MPRYVTHAYPTHIHVSKIASKKSFSFVTVVSQASFLKMEKEKKREPFMVINPYQTQPLPSNPSHMITREQSHLASVNPNTPIAIHLLDLGDLGVLRERDFVLDALGREIAP